MNQNKNNPTNWDSIFRNGINIVILVVILGIKGLYDFAKFSWSWEKLATTEYWLSIAIQVVLMVMIKMAAFNTFTSHARKKNTELQFQISKNKRLLKLREADFPSWVENVKNKELKVNAWKLKVNKLKIKLEKKGKIKDRQLYFSDDKNDEYMKENNEYCKNRRKYDEWLSDEWIEKNYHNLDIKKYEKLDPSSFDVPVALNTNNSAYQISSKTKLAITTSLISSACGMIVWQMVIQGLAYTFDTNNLLNSIINLLLDIFMMTQQFASGAFSSYRIINNQEVGPYINRNRILEEYLHYKKPGQESLLDRILEDINAASQAKEEKGA